MSGKFSRDKGKRGEREFAALISELTGYELTRNLNQSRESGHDLNGIEWISLEVKNQNVLKINDWWKQTVEQAKSCNKVPVLAYKIPYSGWRVRMQITELLGIKVPETVQWHYDICYTAEISAWGFVTYLNETVRDL